VNTNEITTHKCCAIACSWFSTFLEKALVNLVSSTFALVFPLVNSPSLPRATAWGFFISAGISSVFSGAARSAADLASWFVYRGRLGFFMPKFSLFGKALIGKIKSKLRYYPTRQHAQPKADRDTLKHRRRPCPLPENENELHPGLVRRRTIY
jgi:hypothetical protein